MRLEEYVEHSSIGQVLSTKRHTCRIHQWVPWVHHNWSHGAMVSIGWNHVRMIWWWMIDGVGVHVQGDWLHLRMGIWRMGVTHDWNMPPWASSGSPGVWELNFLRKPQWCRLVCWWWVWHCPPAGSGRGRGNCLVGRTVVSPRHPRTSTPWPVHPHLLRVGPRERHQGRGLRYVESGSAGHDHSGH